MKKILITSALPYVNNVPHLGNIIGCVLSADVFARYNRSRGRNTRYICGADEHGTTTEAKAQQEGLTPKQVCDKYYKLHKQIYDWFGISFDVFGRTSTKTHKQITQDIFLKLKENNYISEAEIEQLYCEKCSKSLADRFVEGSCPYCGYENARGDQCDKCGRLLNATELKNPVCKLCKSKPIRKKTMHVFLELDKLQPELEKWIKKQSKQGFWTDNTIRYTNSWLKEGLKKRCISRELKWGIPIPMKGHEDKVFYVWFDAPIGYISITANNFNDWKEWWKKPDDVLLYQFMGKDNVPFHSIIFPATLLGTQEKYTLVHHINTTEYLNYEDGKFSKSRNIGVFGDDAMKLGIPADVFRYYLLINRPEKADTQFSWDDFQEKLNHELIGTLGNLVNRTVVFLNKYYDSKLPGYEPEEKEQEFVGQIKEKQEQITRMLESIKLKEALKELMSLCALGNKFFQEAEPWKNVKQDKKRADNAMHLLANLAKDIAILCRPWLPFSSDKIFRQLNIKEKQWGDLGRLSLKKGHELGKAEALYSKLTEEQKKELKIRFSPGEPEAEKEKTGFDLLNLKVAEIKDVQEHPKADKLIIMKISLGEEQRQIVAGIKNHYSKEELKGKKIVVVTNLKPAVLRGEKSEGMLLACQDKTGTLGLATVKAEPGSQVLIEGADPNQEQITIDDFAKVKLEAKQGRAVSEGKVLKAGNKEVLVERDVEGRIR